MKQKKDSVSSETGQRNSPNKSSKKKKKKNKKKKKVRKKEKKEDSSRDLQDNIKQTNIHIIGVPEGKER